jgi:hypothetical protein
MKIRPPIESVAAELESWALAAGWKTVAGLVAAEYHSNGGGDLLPIADSETGLRNVVQRLRRIFRGYDGPRYAHAAEELKSSVLFAMPTDRRARIESPGDPVRLAAVAAKEGIEAVNSVHLRAAPAIALKEINEAISAFMEMKSVIEPLCCPDAREVYRRSYA